MKGLILWWYSYNNDGEKTCHLPIHNAYGSTMWCVVRHSLHDALVLLLINFHAHGYVMYVYTHVQLLHAMDE